MKEILCYLTAIIVLFGGLAMPHHINGYGDSQFSFNGNMSEKTLLNYISRAVTFQGLCGEGKEENLLIKEDIRMLQRTGTKFVSRAALFAWTSTDSSHVEKHFEYAKKTAAMVHKADPEIILQAFVAEIVRRSYVDHIAIPTWVFEAFGEKPENRNFRFDDIIDKKRGPDVWGKDAGYPDYSNQETLYWYYYCIRRYIDIGYESIHIQENDVNDPSEIPNVDKLLTMCREYASKKARRKLVLFHSFFAMQTGGSKVGNRLLFDIQGNGLVPNETTKEEIKGETVLKCEISSYKDNWLSWFGRSNGGKHPLGFNVEICPTLLEFDNYGQGTPEIKLGQPTPKAFYNWGYDDITWFAIQPEWYRNEFLMYLDGYMKKHELASGNKQYYFPMYPMRRIMTADPNWPQTGYTMGKNSSIDFILDYASSIDKIDYEILPDKKTFKLTTKAYYRANRKSDGCPNGFNQEDTIRKIFLGSTPENPAYNTVVFPDGYSADPQNNKNTVPTAKTSSKRTKSNKNDNPNINNNINTNKDSNKTSNDKRNAYENKNTSIPNSNISGEKSNNIENTSNNNSKDTKQKPKKPLLIKILVGVFTLIAVSAGVIGVLFYKKKKTTT